MLRILGASASWSKERRTTRPPPRPARPTSEGTRRFAEPGSGCPSVSSASERGWMDHTGAKELQADARRRAPIRSRAPDHPDRCFLFFPLSFFHEVGPAKQNHRTKGPGPVGHSTGTGTYGNRAEMISPFPGDIRFSGGRPPQTTEEWWFKSAFEEVDDDRRRCTSRTPRR